MKLIRDIAPPDDRPFTTNFALDINELKLLEEGLLMLLSMPLKSRKKATQIVALKEGFTYARHSLQGVVDEVLREHGEL